jgi:nucleoside-diphosphate-sugar epimerase
MKINYMSKIKICITGGSGFIGTNAMNWALSKYDTINLDIHPPKILEQQKYWQYVDIRDFETFKKALLDFQPTHIIHLAAKTGMNISDMTFFDANTKGVENLIKATQELTCVKRVVFASTLLICKNGYVPISDTEYDPPNLYGESKVIGEKLVRESKMKCSWVIVRPTSIWGPWFEHSYRTFFQVINRGLYFQPGSIPIVKPLSFVGNTVHMIQTLLMYPDDSVDKNTYYLGDYPENSIQVWADLIRKNLGKGKTPVFPIFFMKLLALIGDIFKNLGWADPPITTFRLNNMLTGTHYPIEKIQEVVGSLPHTLGNGVHLTLCWMYDQKLITHKPIISKTNSDEQSEKIAQNCRK